MMKYFTLRAALRMTGELNLSCRHLTNFTVREDLRTNAPTSSAASFEVKNPAFPEQAIATVSDMSADEAIAKIKKAAEAQEKWAAVPAKQRATILSAWHDAVVEETQYLAALITAEQGKPLTESIGEVGYGASFLSWYAEEAKRLYGDIIPAASPHQKLFVLKQPVGVCSLITPWNFPLAMITRKAGAALAAGCTAVIKPAEDTPLTAEALVSLAHTAGVPEGVLEVVTCSRAGVVEIGHELVTNELIQKVSFTGSTAVGKRLTALAANTVKRVSMELGGNAPFIVFADADLDAAVEGAIASKFRNSGQTCVCANRFLIHEAVHDTFVKKLVVAVAKLSVGDGSQRTTTQGPLINAAAVAKVTQLVSDTIAAGGSLVAGGTALEPCGKGGTFFAPTVITNITPAMDINQTEIFGPVAAISTFSTDSEAISRANSTRAGLVGYFYTKDLGRLFKVAEALQFGMVGVNSGIISTEVAPFGGVKESGVGREGSRYGIDEYVESKYVLLQT